MRSRPSLSLSSFRSPSVAALAWVLLAGCGATPSLFGDGAVAGPADMSIGGAQSDQGQDPCAVAGYPLVPYLAATAQHDFPKADPVLEMGRDYRAVIVTDVGRVVLDLFEVDTPITVNSFVFLALHHYFDGIGFHRVLSGFMAQTGDPNTIDGDSATWGQGGPGYFYGLEVRPNLNFDAAGVVGMARTNDPNSNGSQFFITFAKQSSLDQMYTVFGKVVEGQNVLAKVMLRDPMKNPSDAMTRMTRVCIVAK